MEELGISTIRSKTVSKCPTNRFMVSSLKSAVLYANVALIEFEDSDI